MLAAGVLELRLVAKGLVLGMRCTSVSLRNKWTALLGKLLRRISTSIHFVLHKWSTGPGTASLGTAEEAERARDIDCKTLCLLSGVVALQCIALAVCPLRSLKNRRLLSQGDAYSCFRGVNIHVQTQGHHHKFWSGPVTASHGHPLYLGMIGIPCCGTVNSPLLPMATQRFCCGTNSTFVAAALRPVAAWTQWFTRLLLGSLYPGAPFERKFMAMLLLETLVTTWNSPDKANRQNFRY